MSEQGHMSEADPRCCWPSGETPEPMVRGAPPAAKHLHSDQILRHRRSQWSTGRPSQTSPLVCFLVEASGIHCAGCISVLRLPERHRRSDQRLPTLCPGQCHHARCQLHQLGKPSRGQRRQMSGLVRPPASACIFCQTDFLVLCGATRRQGSGREGFWLLQFDLAVTSE